MPCAVAPVIHGLTESSRLPPSHTWIHTANRWAQNRKHRLFTADQDYWSVIIVFFRIRFKNIWQITRVTITSVCRWCLETKGLWDSANFFLLLNTHKTHKCQGERGWVTTRARTHTHSCFTLWHHSHSVQSNQNSLDITSLRTCSLIPAVCVFSQPSKATSLPLYWQCATLHSAHLMNDY